MSKNKIIKQITITQRDIVYLVIDELFNLGFIDESEDKEIYDKVSFELIQSYCSKNIEEVLKNFKTGIDEMEMEEFEFWFGFDTKRFMNEIINKIIK